MHSRTCSPLLLALVVSLASGTLLSVGGGSAQAASRTTSDHFVFSFSKPVKVSGPVNVTIKAYGTDNALDSSFSEKGTLSCGTNSVTSAFSKGVSVANVTCPVASTSQTLTLTFTAVNGTKTTASSPPFDVVGSLNHFNVDLPARVRLASTFTVKITAVDSVGHTLTDFSAKNLTWSVADNNPNPADRVGKAALFPATPIPIAGGVSITSTKIETPTAGVVIEVQGQDRKYQQGISKKIAVVGVPARLTMAGIPAKIKKVGDPITVSVLAYDKAGNVASYFTSPDRPTLTDNTGTLDTSEIGTFFNGVSVSSVSVGKASPANKIYFKYMLGSVALTVDSNTFAVT